MAQPIACDICSLEEAVQMLTNLTDGSVLAIGPACMPSFYGNSALVTMDAGQHKGPATKCQACRRMHERMTTPVAPLDMPAGPTVGEVPTADTADPHHDPAVAYAAGDDNPHRLAPSPEAEVQ